MKTASASKEINQSIYDVVICGGGLAGLTLARQLKLTQPEISILVCDRFTRPLPTKAFKVGESTVEIGTHYLTEMLQLEDYFNQHHIPKLGLRFFLGDSNLPLCDRPEIGVTDFNVFHSKFTYHFDRSILESDLREFAISQGIDLLENCSVQDIQLALASFGKAHRIFCKLNDSKEVIAVQGRWVIDATGRRQMLQKKLNLKKDCVENNRNAVWFRMDAIIDVSELVPASSPWHDRVPGNQRYFSGNHLTGEGYWVWLLPLSTGHTSIGIVTSPETHEFQDLNTYEKALIWLRIHEPLLAKYLQNRPHADFMKMPKFSYSSKQVFSRDRWACIGEAGTFADPLYSPGTDMIAISNTLTAELIRLDLQGTLSQKMVDHANQFYLQTNDHATQAIGGSYQFFGKSPALFMMQFLWKAAYVWSTNTPMILSSAFLDPGRTAQFEAILTRFSTLAHQVDQLFQQWANQPSQQLTFEFFDYLGMLPFMDELRQNLFQPKNDQQLKDHYSHNLDLLEELAQAIFFIALEDTAHSASEGLGPTVDHQFASPIWLNAWAVSLDETQWEQDGLFQPTSPPRNLNRIMIPLKRHLHQVSYQNKHCQNIDAARTQDALVTASVS